MRWTKADCKHSARTSRLQTCPCRQSCSRRLCGAAHGGTFTQTASTAISKGGAQPRCTPPPQAAHETHCRTEPGCRGPVCSPWPASAEAATVWRCRRLRARSPSRRAMRRARASQPCRAEVQMRRGEVDRRREVIRVQGREPVVEPFHRPPATAPPHPAAPSSKLRHEAAGCTVHTARSPTVHCVA